MAAIFRIDVDTVIITSTAAIYGPAFVGPVANAIKNPRVIVSGITMGLLGYSFGDIVGKTPEQVCTNEVDLAMWQENNRRAFNGERVEGEVTMTVRGEERHYNNVITPVHDNDQIQGILGVNIDITERKRAELALREAKEFSENLIDSMLDGCSVVDAQGIHIKVNAARK